jgi:hypothetical protein
LLETIEEPDAEHEATASRDPCLLGTYDLILSGVSVDGSKTDMPTVHFKRGVAEIPWR